DRNPVAAGALSLHRGPPAADGGPRVHCGARRDPQARRSPPLSPRRRSRSPPRPRGATHQRSDRAATLARSTPARRRGPARCLARWRSTDSENRRRTMLLQEMTWPEISNLSRDIPVMVPVAALEQHGRHMPVFTDSLLVGEVVRRVGAAMSDRVLFAPLMWLGNSHHHLDFPGTLTASPRTYLDLLIDLAEDSIIHGFRRIIMLNGHGGNIVPSQQALFELRQKYRSRGDLLLLSATYWLLGAQPHKEMSETAQTQMGHACEWETSMMLRLAPHLVRDLDKVQPV